MLSLRRLLKYIRGRGQTQNSGGRKNLLQPRTQVLFPDESTWVQVESFVTHHHPVWIRVYPRKGRWPDLPSFGSKYEIWLTSSHSPSRSIHSLLPITKYIQLLWCTKPCETLYEIKSNCNNIFFKRSILYSLINITKKKYKQKQYKYISGPKFKERGFALHWGGSYASVITAEKIENMRLFKNINFLFVDYTLFS